MIVNTVVRLVEEMFEFQHSDLGQELKDQGAPPYYWKYIKLITHRRAGFTTAALTLLDGYTSSLIITPSVAIDHYVQRLAHDKNLVGEDLQEYLKDHIVAEWLVNDRWFEGRLPEQRHQLIILDPASMIESQRGVMEMDKLRYRLFEMCDILIELE